MRVTRRQEHPMSYFGLIFLSADEPILDAGNPLGLLTSATFIAAVLGALVTILITTMRGRGQRKRERLKHRRSVTYSALEELRQVFVMIDALPQPMSAPGSSIPAFEKYEVEVLPVLREVRVKIKDITVPVYIAGLDWLLIQMRRYDDILERFIRQAESRPPRKSVSSLQHDLELERYKLLSTARKYALGSEDVSARRRRAYDATFNLSMFLIMGSVLTLVVVVLTAVVVGYTPETLLSLTLLLAIPFGLGCLVGLISMFIDRGGPHASEKLARSAVMGEDLPD
jgi:F0F1-type ATP synthase assembly protein I